MISDVSTSPAIPAHHSARLRAVTSGRGYDYLLSLPDDYATRPRTKWPLLLFLHGSGQRGSDVWLVAQHGLPRLLAEPAVLTPAEQAAAAQIAKSFIVVAPQCSGLEVWDDAAVLALLDHASTTLEVDPARTYLAGLSMGAFGAWSIAMRHPQRFAALIAVCGGGRVADITSAAGAHKTALQQLGVWAFHGARDRVVPLEESERMVAAMKNIGAKDVRLTIYPEAEHDAWTAAFANAELYPWLLTHSR
jgi:predicted peptidase